MSDINIKREAISQSYKPFHHKHKHFDREILVEGMSMRTKEESVLRYMSQFGAVDTLSIYSSKRSQTALLTLTDAEHARQISIRDHWIDNKRVNARLYILALASGGCLTVNIDGIPPSIPAEGVAEALKCFGRVIHASIKHNSNIGRASKGFGVFCFDCPDSAKDAAKEGELMLEGQKAKSGGRGEVFDKDKSRDKLEYFMWFVRRVVNINKHLDIGMSSSRNIERMSKWSRRLQRVQTYSGVAFGGFALQHTLPALLASVGQLELSEQVVMIERAVYHSPYVEVVWVIGSISVHVIAGILRRVVLKKTAKENNTQHTLTTQQKAGWMLTPLLTTHYLIHRSIPSLDTPPIRSLSPSELSYPHFVGYAVQALTPRAVISATALTALSTLTVYHSLAGLWRGKKNARTALRCSVVNGVSVLAALVNMGRAYSSVSYLEPRYEAVYGYLGL